MDRKGRQNFWLPENESQCCHVGQVTFQIFIDSCAPHAGKLAFHTICCVTHIMNYFNDTCKRIFHFICSC